MRSYYRAEGQEQREPRARRAPKYTAWFWLYGRQLTGICSLLLGCVQSLDKWNHSRGANHPRSSSADARVLRNMCSCLNVGVLSAVHTALLFTIVDGNCCEMIENLVLLLGIVNCWGFVVVGVWSITTPR